MPMRKEYDLISELGRGNWIDEVAGEAVLLGYSCADPELEARGAQLSMLVREIKFDSDQFYRVEVAAKELQRLVGIKKRQESVFLDKIVECETDRWPNNDWRYVLNCIEGVYRIQIVLPTFYSERELSGKNDMESAVLKTYADPSFLSYERKRVVGKSIFTQQKVWNDSYYDQENKLRREVVVHEHQDDSSRGFREVFYFDGLAQAATAWTSLREAFTSGRKK